MKKEGLLKIRLFWIEIIFIGCNVKSVCRFGLYVYVMIVLLVEFLIVWIRLLFGFFFIYYEYFDFLKDRLKFYLKVRNVGLFFVIVDFEIRILVLNRCGCRNFIY